MDCKRVRALSFACLVFFLTSMASCGGPPNVTRPAGTPTVALSRSTIPFGNVAVNTTATAQVSIKNDGTADLIIHSITVSGAGFSQSSTCLATIAVGGTCSITVSLKPIATGEQTGTVTIAPTLPRIRRLPLQVWVFQRSVFRPQV